MSKLGKVSPYQGHMGRSPNNTASPRVRAAQSELAANSDGRQPSYDDKVSMSLTRSTLVQLKSINLHELGRFITFVNAHYDALKSLRQTLSLIGKTLDDSSNAEDPKQRKALTSVVDMLHDKLAELANRHPNEQVFRALLRFPDLTAEKLEVEGPNLGELIPPTPLRKSRITQYRSDLRRSMRQVDTELKRFYSMRSQINDVIQIQCTKTSEESAFALADEIAAELTKTGDASALSASHKLDNSRVRFFLSGL